MLFSVLRSFSWSSLLPFLAACIEKEEKKLENNFCIWHFLSGGGGAAGKARLMGSKWRKWLKQLSALNLRTIHIL